MKKICVICNKEFESRNKTHLCCSFACKEERRRRIAREWKRKHPNANKEYRERRKARLLAKSKEVEQQQEAPAVEIHVVTASKDDPEWIKTYVKSDIITQITMLARELNNVCVDEPIFTYGKLSQIRHTEKYYKLEEDIFKRKRLEHERSIKGDS